MPIFNTDVFQEGKPWPPRALNAELDKYYKYSRGQFAGLSELAEPRITFNAFRWIENFWADAIASESPIIEYEKASDGERDLVREIQSDLTPVIRVVTRHLIRYGTGCFLNRLPNSPQACDPRYWFPVTRPAYAEQGDVSIVAYPYTTNELNPLPDRLHVAEYTGGVVEIRERILQGSTIGRVVELSRETCGDPAVIAVTEDGSLFGQSDFPDILPFVAELQRRFTGISRALDQHQNPHLAVPVDALNTDNAGNETIDLSEEGQYIPFPVESALPKYISWQPDFSAQNAAIEEADLRILRLARISPVLVHLQEKTGQLASGSALRRLSVPTVLRIRVIRSVLDKGIASTIAGNAAMLSTPTVLDPERVKVTWPEPLGTGLVDEAEHISTLVESGLLSRNTAVRMVNHVSEEGAEEINDQYLEEIEKMSEAEGIGIDPI